MCNKTVSLTTCFYCVDSIPAADTSIGSTTSFLGRTTFGRAGTGSALGLKTLVRKSGLDAATLIATSSSDFKLACGS